MRSTAYDATKAPWDETAGAPVYVLELQWPNGTLYYGARAWTSGAITVLDRVTSWDGLTQVLADAKAGGVTSSQLQGNIPGVTVSLRDDDKTLLAKMRAEQLQGRVAKVYLAEAGQQVNYYLVFDGEVSAKPRWMAGSLKLRLSSGQKTVKRLVGNIVNTDDFPTAYPDHVGRMLPICFGTPTRVRASALTHGSRGRLRDKVAAADLTLYIEGFEHKDPSEVVTLQIGLERLTGSFKGSTFTAASRGGGVVASGTLVSASTRVRANVLNVSTADLGTVDNFWTGMMCKMTVPQAPPVAQTGNPWKMMFPFGSRPHVIPTNRWGAQYRLIVRYDATNEELFVGPSFSFEDSTEADSESGRVVLPSAISYAGHVWIPPSGASYEITTMAMPHEKGEAVWEIATGGAVYAIADHACQAVRAIYGRGVRKEAPVPRKEGWMSPDNQLGGGSIGILGGEGTDNEPAEADRQPEWIEIPPELYVINLNDSTSFPSLGRNLTTVTFPTPITTLLGWAFEDVELLADVEGYVSGSLVVNPIEALEDILGVWASDIPLDSAAFTTAATSVDWLKVDFALTEQMPAQRIAAEMAWQSRCRAVWRDGLLSVHFLKNDPTTHVDHVYGEVVEGSRELSKRPMDGIVTELEYEITVRGDTKRYKEEDIRSISKYGRRGCGVKEFWAFERQTHAQAVARFWLNRMKHEGLYLRLRTPLVHVRNEPGDEMKVYSQGFLTDAYDIMEVVGIEHKQGDVKGGSPPEVELLLAEPYGWEAPWTCPGADACTGCDIYCEVSADVLACVAAADIGCDVFDFGDGSDPGWGLGNRFEFVM